jgi:hypothetical protein
MKIILPDNPPEPFTEVGRMPGLASKLHGEKLGRMENRH